MTVRHGVLDEKSNSHHRLPSCALIMTTRVGYFGLAELHSVGLADADWELPETAQAYWANGTSLSFPRP